MIENTAPATIAQLDREAMMVRSKALHALSVQHFQAVEPFLSSARAQGYAKRLSRLCAEAWTGDDTQALFLVELAVWTADEGRSTALQRYARQRSALMTSDEIAVLAGMQMSVISCWTVQEAHPVAGWIVRDLLNEGTVWVVDETLEELLAEGARPNFLTRLFRAEQEGFWMTCGAMVTAPEALDTFRVGQGKDAFQSGSAQHAVRSRQSAYVSTLCTVVPRAG
jgi:hypothetical protein